MNLRIRKVNYSVLVNMLGTKHQDYDAYSIVDKLDALIQVLREDDDIELASQRIEQILFATNERCNFLIRTSNFVDVDLIFKIGNFGSQFL